MAFLHVVAISEDASLIQSNQVTKHIIVAVTTNRGKPVTDLQLQDFSIKGCDVQHRELATLQSVNALKNQEGVYNITVIIHTMQLSANERSHIVAVSVKHGIHRGLTLCSVTLN